jgi:signal transduction histidine kinase
MNERAKQIGGHFHLQSQPGKGTTISVAVPIPAKQGEPL